MTEEIILSICIPTYNRAAYLDKCLQSITKELGNNNSVEIVISDNVSTDDTQKLCEDYNRVYANVRYYRNDTNIGGDRNFLRVLSLGNGKYLKLLNDYVEFKEGAALKMLEIVSAHAEEKKILFFANGVSYLKHKDYYYSKDLDEFLKVCSFWSTWIGAIGFWKEDFQKMMSYYQFKTKSFYQTELLFENFRFNKEAVTYSRKILDYNDVLNKQTGYNFFDTFINSYFNTIVVGLKKENKISNSTFLKEKNRFFSDFIFNWYKKIRIKNNNAVSINDQGAETIIFNTYKYSPILYLYMLYLPFYMIGFYFKKMKNSAGSESNNT